MADGAHEEGQRLSAEQQAEYQQTYNDPAKRGSVEWLNAGQALMAAGVLRPDEMIDADLATAYGKASEPEQK